MNLVDTSCMLVLSFIKLSDRARDKVAWHGLPGSSVLRSCGNYNLIKKYSLMSLEHTLLNQTFYL